MSLRVVHVLAEIGYSGGEMQLEHLVRHLTARGHENHVIVPPGARFGDVCRAIGVPFSEVNVRRPWWSPAVWQIRRQVRDLRPDVVHLCCGRANLWGGLAVRGLPVPLRVTTRRIDYPVSKSWKGVGRYRDLVDHAITNCAAVRRRLIDAGVPGDGVTVIHEGVEHGRWTDLRPHRAAARERLGVPGDALVISCAATLRPRKGQGVLIDAFARIAARFPAAVLVLAGEGSDLERLRQRARNVGFEHRILFPGVIDPVRDLHAASDVAAMVSFHEGLSNACLEAAASGQPLVVSAVGGLPDIVVDGLTGFVVPPGDDRAVADRLARLLEDAALRRRAGELGSRRVRDLFTVERVVRQTEELWLRMLETRTGRRRMFEGTQAPRIVIIKTGALGDVLRTTSILPGLAARHPGARITWLTAPAAIDLVRHHPLVDEALAIDLDDAADVARVAAPLREVRWTRVLSFDDEFAACELASSLPTDRLSGACLDANGRRGYTDDVEEWFGMGLLSRDGKQRADDRKRHNQRSHPQIFADMLGIEPGRPELPLADELPAQAAARLGREPGSSSVPLIGLNTGAGARWPTKALSPERVLELVERLHQIFGGKVRFALFGGAGERERNSAIAALIAASPLAPACLDTGANNAMLDFAALIDQCDVLVSSDSLGMHVAIARGVPVVAFFAPTSAAEIELYGNGEKVISTTPDYCNYRPDADNSTITADRVADAVVRVLDPARAPVSRW